MSEPVKRLLVTGGSGFIGTNLVDFYVGQGAEVLNLDLAPPVNLRHTSLWHQVDVLDRPALRRATGDFSPTHLVHLAARTDLEGDTVEDYRANTEGVSNLTEAIGGFADLRRVVFTSSRLVCRIGYQPKGDEDYCPSTAYGESKVAGERLVRGASLASSWTIARPTSIWGPWFGVPYRTFFDQIARRRYFHPRGMRILKSFGFVGNTVHQLDKILTAPEDDVDETTVYLADYVPVELSDMAHAISRRMGKGPVRSVPLPLLRAAGALGDVLRAAGWRDVPLTTFRLENLLTDMVFDHRRLRAIVGELPYSLDEGIDATVTWMERCGEGQSDRGPVGSAESASAL